MACAHHRLCRHLHAPAGHHGRQRRPPRYSEGAPRLLHRPPVGGRRLRPDARDGRPHRRLARPTCSAGSGCSSAASILFTAASAVCGAATSPLLLNLSRGVQGIGGGIMFAVSLAILSQEFHGKERGTAFGIWGATVGIRSRGRAARRRRADDVGRLAVDLLRQRADRDRLRRRVDPRPARVRDDGARRA